MFQIKTFPRAGARLFLLAAAIVYCCIHLPAHAVGSLPDSALSSIAGAVEQAIAAGRIPGAVVVIGNGERVLYRKAFGCRSLRPAVTPMSEDVLFDVASLTKVIATATAVMQLVEKGRLKLDAPAANYWPGFARRGKGAITLRHLLTHYSGLRPELRLPRHENGRPAAVKAILREKPLHPAGRRYRYSDLNFIILGEIVRRASGEPLDRYCAAHIFKPLGMHETTFRPAAVWRDRIAPTISQEGGDLCGEVHDPICSRMGGVAGHAGLFSSADDLTKFAQMMLNGGRLNGNSVLQVKTVEAMTRPQSPAATKRLRGLGWDLDAPLAANAEELPTVGAYSHVGYTGTGIWIDPVTDTYLILLTNRVHAGRGGSVTELRKAIKKQLGDAVGPVSKEFILQRRHRLAEFVSSSVPERSAKIPAVETGIDVLEKENFKPLAGLRVGLITNQTGRNAAGRRTIDVLYAAPGVHLQAVFSPEHGIDGTLDAWVASSRDGQTGLPIYSLYGATCRPSPGWLKDLDALVFDIQDAGARFYTFISTMGYAMEAAAQRGIPFFVLDRPNPITGLDAEGPLSFDIPRSFTAYYPLPVRHGMTVGELARLFNAECRIDVDLRIVTMRGYKRDQWFDETGLAWINPSPNLRSLEETLLYPGVALLESANVSVGRGTATPFELVGAPWIAAEELTKYLEGRGLPGVRFSPASFTPQASAYRRLPCHGVRISLTDRKAFNPVQTGIEIAAALRRLYAGFFHIEDTIGMIGSRRVVDAIDKGIDPAAIVASWQNSLDAFRRLRAGYLLY